MDTLPTLAGERVVLRWLTDADVPALFGIFSNPEVMRYWSSLPQTDPAQAVALLADIHENFRTGTLWQWGVARRADNRVVGTCTLFHFDERNRRAEVGFALDRAHWGTGVMHEALSVLLAHAFGPLNLHRLEADVDPRNEASLRRLQALGFRREGLLRERWLVGGDTQDSLLLGLLRREWAALQ